MYNQHYSIVINAPKQKVWEIMLADATYREWTTAFSPDGSHFEGNWEEGSKIRFVGSDETAEIQGMVCIVKANKPGEFVSLEISGFAGPNGSEDTESDEAKKWKGGLENYTFIDHADGTELKIDLMNEQEADPEFAEQMKAMWPAALKKLKEIVESN
ncbi:MAG TPA: SRPBCC domain-containing protein [Candidatus Paceibacterota bacterium]